MTEAVVQKCFISKRFSKIYCNTPVLEPLSYKVVGCMPATSLKQRLQNSRFPANYAKFLRTSFFKRTAVDKYFCDEYLVPAIVLEQLARIFPVQTGVSYQ